MTILTLALISACIQTVHIPGAPGDTGDSGAAIVTDSGDDTADSDPADSTDTSGCVDVPLADAGPDQTVDLGTGPVQMAGTGSGGCGAYQYTWELVAIPSGSALASGDIETTDAEDPTLTPDSAGSFVLSLAVYDGAQWSSPDEVAILVSDCSDGIDDDGDGWVDSYDPDCASVGYEDGVGTTECNDGLDNDRDGAVDSADPDCTDAADASEGDGTSSTGCTNGIDDDGDGWIDAYDPDCTSGTDEVGFGATECNDGIDNDGDGRADAADAGCSDASDTSEA